ncbi:hypothetical protein [Enterococcus sp. BWT-B8]|nr:hypothetical protein [Enterococcus sp. BWT-B8]
MLSELYEEVSMEFLEEVEGGNWFLDWVGWGSQWADTLEYW